MTIYLAVQSNPAPVERSYESQGDVANSNSNVSLYYQSTNHGVLLDSSGYYPNLAVYGASSQSSTFSHSCNPTASKATDGKNEGVFSWCSVTHKNEDQQAWWQVDLQGSRTVHRVHVFNRVDCCRDRLANFNVTLRNSTRATLATKNFSGGTNSQIYTFSKTVDNVRFVRVHLLGKGVLSLAEVQVIGNDGNGRNDRNDLQE